MARVVTLGTAAVVRDAEHAHTYMALEGEQRFFLIDCADSPLVRMKQAGLELDRLEGLIVTHFHPDHTMGIPIMMVGACVLGRTASIAMYGLQDVIERFETMMDLYRWDEWPSMFPVPCHAVDERVGALVLEDDEFLITGAPVKHLVPTMALRIEDKRAGGVLTYSSDTEPCEAVLTLAQGADVLIHEAAENTLGHSSAAQAGEIARQAGVGRLILIHYRPAPHKYDTWIKEAGEAFGGPVSLAQDFDTYEF